MSLYNALALQDTINQSLISQDRIGESLSQQFGNLIEQRGARGSGVAIWVGDTPIVVAGYSGMAEAESLHTRLMALPATPIGPGGESVIVDRESPDGEVRNGLLLVPAGASHPSVTMLSSGNSVPRA